MRRANFLKVTFSFYLSPHPRTPYFSSPGKSTSTPRMGFIMGIPCHFFCVPQKSTLPAALAVGFQGKGSYMTQEETLAAAIFFGERLMVSLKTRSTRACTLRLWLFFSSAAHSRTAQFRAAAAADCCHVGIREPTTEHTHVAGPREAGMHSLPPPPDKCTYAPPGKKGCCVQLPALVYLPPSPRKMG